MTTDERKIELLLEAKEHVVDCDYNRAQHFNMYDRYMFKAKAIRLFEAAFLFGIILCYIVSATIPGWNNSKISAIAPVALSILALCLQMFDYYTNYDDKADHHWMAAQAYSRLYRECQFLPVHYEKIPTGEFIRTLHDICIELHDLNTLSPHLDNKSYIKVKDGLKDKEYPVDRLINVFDDKLFKNFVDNIKDICKDYLIEIYLFGSYVRKPFYNDIDIAIIVYGDSVDGNEIEAKVVEIESKYSDIPFDITIIYEKDFQSEEMIPLIRNIQKGRCLFSSQMINRKLQDRTIRQPNYYSIVESYYKRMPNANDVIGDSVTLENYLKNAYHCYYYIIASVLDSKTVKWDGECTLIYEFKKIAENEKYGTVLKRFLLLRKKMYSSDTLALIDESFIKDANDGIKEYLSNKDFV